MTVKQFVSVLGFLCIMIFAMVFGPLPFADAQKVHALLITLGNDRDIRTSVEKNESSMQTLLRQVSENCEVRMTIMKSTDETTGTINEKTLANGNVTAQSSPQQLGIIKANQVVQWIRDLKTEGDDTILIYYSGHGSIDAVGTHILNFDPEVTNDFVARDGLRKQLEQKQGRLKMLITDTCSNRVQTPPPIARVYAKVQSRERRYTKNLFLEHSGFVDITAASEGQYAWGNDDIGGYFTVSLIGSFTAEADANQDGFLSWEEVSDVTRSKTQKLFSETIFLPHHQRKLDEAGQTSQTPTKYSVPVRLTQTVEMSTAPVVSLLLTPAEKLTSGDPVAFSLIGFDVAGKQTSAISAIQWTKTGLTGTLENSTFTPDKSAGAHAGTVTVQSDDMKATARIRVIPPLPWTEDFEAIKLEKIPTHWIGATGKFFVREKGGNKILVKPPPQRGLSRSNVYIGPSTMKDYQIQVDLMGTNNKRRVPDMGLIANRYTLDMQGRHQRLQIRSWATPLRMAKTIDFAWKMDVWYTMKMMVEIMDDKAIIRGKVWRRGEDEPTEWTITAEDPLPNREGSPGIYGYSPTEIHYDNLKVISSQKKFLYTRGDILLIADGKPRDGKSGHLGYFAEIMADTQLNSPEVSVRFFVKEIRKKLGDKISIDTVIAKREKPENGWGTQKVLLEYFDGKTWIFSKDATVFEDHYLLPESVNSERKIPFNKVRIPIFGLKKVIQ